MSTTATTEQAPQDPGDNGGVTVPDALDRWFRITERGSSVGQEVRGGLVTFVAMAYIIVLNPVILGSAADVNGDHLPLPAIGAATALIAGLMTVAFGAIARYPFGIAAGLGINTLVAVTLAQQMTWAEAMGLVILDGVIIVLLTLTGVRSAVYTAIPRSLRAAIVVGIGLFIALIGLVDSGFVRRIPDAAHTTVPVELGIGGSIASWPTFVFVVGLLLCGVLVARQVRGGLLIGIVVTTIIAIIVESLVAAGPSVSDAGFNPKGWNLTVPSLPDSIGGLPDLSIVGNVDLFGAVTRVGALTATLLVFTLVLANFFDAMGTMTGLGHEAGLTDKDGNLPNMKTAFIIEGVGAVAGGVGNVSSNTVYVDSAAGIADGARTGLANVVTGLIFLAAMFFTPVYAIVPIEAAAPALVVVGALMMGQIKEIDFSRFDVALPAFLVIVTMPFTYSIANGIGVGFVSYVVLSLFTGQARRVHPLLWVVAALFVVFFAIGPVSAALV